MDSYPCPACGGVATEAEGCRSCRRAHDPVAAALAHLDQAMAGLDDETRQIAATHTQLRERRAKLLAQRKALTDALVRKLAEESAGQRRGAASRVRTDRPPRQRRTAATSDTADLGRGAGHAAPPIADDPGHIGAETSPRSAQNTLLTLGGLLLGIAAVVFTALFYSTTQTGGRAFILGIATTLALALPVLLARRRLTATAETIAAIGMLLVLLDGYAAYLADLAGLASVSAPLFAAVLFSLVAVVALAYRLATHLRAPQFAGLLAVQPLLPLAAVHFGLGGNALAAVFTLVAAQNLAAVMVLGREPVLRPRLPRDPSVHPPLSWPYLLRELAWLLFGLAFLAAAGLAVVAAARAASLDEAIWSALTVLLVAAVCATAGQVSGRDLFRHLAAAVATLGVIAAVGRVNAFALPEFTLVLTAAIATIVAVAATWLPPASRLGAQLGSLGAAALVALAVLVDTAGTVVATIDAATTPAPWQADLAGYAGRIPTTSWQVPAAAALLTVLAAAAVPAGWRWAAVVIGAALTVLAAPGTGIPPWWTVSVLAAGLAAAATVAAVYASDGRAALTLAATAGVVGLYSIATALARPQLTAASCLLIGTVSVGAAVAGARPQLIQGRGPRPGPYAGRVADAAAGAAAITLPVAVATLAHLAGTSDTVLLPVTMLAAAAAVLGVALSQVAARTPRTASGAGAFATAAGCLLLCLLADGTAPADYALAALLVVGAGTAGTARAFELSTGVPAARRLPDGPGGRRRRWPGLPRVDGATGGAALATAAVIVAMARLAAVAVPGIGVVTSSTMVLAVAVAMLLLPEQWRRGPRLGTGVAGAVIVALVASIAVIEAGRVLTAATPFWAVDLASWSQRATGFAPYAWQVPASLLLAAAAAWALLPAPTGGDVGFVTLALAGLSAPAALSLTWWTPIAIAGALAALAGLGAALVTPEQDAGTARRRLGLAGVLGLYAVAASAPRPAATAMALAGVVMVGVLVAAVGRARNIYPEVPGIATAAALAAAPGAAATLAVAGGATRIGVLGTALAVSAFGVAVLAALRAGGAEWGAMPAYGVGAAAVVVALAALAGREAADAWAAGSALVAAGAAATLRIGDPDGGRAALGVVGMATTPATLLAAILTAPAWLAAAVGPYQALSHVWEGYPAAPVPQGARPALLTLALLAAVAAVTAATVGGRRYVLAALLPPLAALSLAVPAALSAPRATTTWVSLAVALTTGIGAALTSPVRPSATRFLRGMAGIVCALTGAAGIAGALATRESTLLALGVVLGAAALAAALGRDPGVRMVAWVVAAAAAFALPVTALLAARRPPQAGAFGVLAACAVLVGVAALLSRRPRRRAEAAVVELTVAVGGALALLLTLGSARHAAAVLTIWGVLLGTATLRQDRPPAHRQWLWRAALAAEVAACWMLLYAAEVGLPEAYTLPFAAAALLAGVLALRRRDDLSSWLAYGPALAGGFLPSLALVLVGADPLWRWVTLFAAAITAVIMGSWRRRQAPVVTGAAVAVLVAVTEMIRLLLQGAVAGAILVAVAGLVLIAFGAVSEKRLRGALRRMS